VRHRVGGDSAGGETSRVADAESAGDAPNHADSAAPGRSLAAITARAIIGWACLATVLVTAIGFLLVSARAEQRAVRELVNYVDQRGRAESLIFRRAEANLLSFRERFLELYNDPAAFQDARFEDYFFEDDAGAIRLRPQYFTGHRGEDGVIRRGTSGFMGRNRPPLTDELKRRLIIAYELADRYGPGWIGQFANFHVSLPENALINHWPEEPWGLSADPELIMTNGAVIRATLQAENPERRPVWSGLYYDLTAGEWAITYQLPVDQDGRHLVNPSHDVLLDDLLARLETDHPFGGRNLILAPNGDLIAQPERMDEIRKHQGVLNVASMGDPDLASIHEALSARGAEAGPRTRFAEIESLDSYIVFTRIDGPGWWFVSIYPRSLLRGIAHESAAILLVLGLVISMLITLVVLAVLRTRVADPIAHLTHASERIAAGDHAAVASGEISLAVDRADEIGILARSFRAMARQIGEANEHLEQTVAARTLELQLANRQLEKLSLRDSLTGAFNRRAFDEDIAEVVSRADALDRRFGLLLCDLDHFKPYNDAYGHIAGDQVLSLIISTMTQCVPMSRVYRYGGEEIAVILDPEELDCATAGLQIVRRIAALRIPHRGSPFGIVTLSAGLAYTSPGLSAQALIERADTELYRAKSGGRNRISVREPEGDDAGVLSGAA
jgi:diguanylate cyclase (GGDEF)-like protein